MPRIPRPVRRDGRLPAVPGDKRFLDISALSDQKALAVCGMTEILKQRFLCSKERLWFHAAIKNLQ